MLFPLDFLHYGKAPRLNLHHDPVKVSGGALGRYGLLLLGLCLITISAPAAEHYVRAGATGDGSGVDWTNAYTELPATPSRGDTYYVAAGSYPGCDIETPASGTSPVMIRKATSWDHGSAPGWDPAWADGVALWDSVYIATSYVIFDGVTGRGRHNHGFEVYRDPSGGRLVELADAAHDVTLRHLHLHYFSRNWDGRADAFYSDSPCSNIVISDCYVHDIPGCPLLMRNWTGLLFERNWVVRNRSTSVNHAEGVSTHGGGNFIFRDNLWQDIEGTAVIVNLYGTTSNWQIYGNMFVQTDASQSNGFGHGLVSDNFTGSDIQGLQFYNNTIVGMRGGASGLQFWSPGTRDIWACNNLWFNCAHICFFGLVYDYNTFSSCTLAFNYTPQPHDLQTTGDPFVNTPGQNFALKQPTAPGLFLPPSLTHTAATITPEGMVDPVGAVRQADGVWDRGAFEYVNPIPVQTLRVPTLVAYWNFDEGMGIMARDASGNNNHGILDGAVWTAAGRKGGALAFRDGNAHVSIPGDASLSLAANRFSFTAWVCPSGTAAPSGTIMQRSNDEGIGVAWRLCARNPNTPLNRGPFFSIQWGGATGSGADGQVEGARPLVPNAWQFLAVTYDGTALRLYVNGVFSGKTVKRGGVVPATGKEICIGANDLTGDPFHGRIDEVQIYNRALSQGEILRLMNR